MLNVLHVHSGNMYGGVETLLFTLARCRDLVPDMGMHVALCFEGRIADELRTAGVPVTMIGAVRLRRPDTVWRARQAMAAMLKREPFDVVVCHQAWPLAVFGPAIKSAGLPLVEWVHMAQSGSHWLERLAGRVQPDCYLCNSAFTASVLPRTDVKVDTIYYPVMAESPSEPDNATTTGAIRRALDTRNEDVVIIQVSRMEAWKGQLDCIEALGILRDVPGWVCWQVGGAQRPMEARYLASVRHAAERLGIAHRIRFLGQRSDVAQLLAAADLFCQPNRDPEPFGISLVEALWRRLPVVSSSIGGAAEIVDTTCGVLVEPKNPTALAAALSALIVDGPKRSQLGSQGPARARTLCDPGAQLAKIAAVFERVGAGREAVH